mmetsp:Transcript_124887/g.229191  ORF Transcript_124887/g.229191 Transcript_124887/m.229191 type:complete len:336 (-) Transcript_124887:117-1124(-)
MSLTRRGTTAQLLMYSGARKVGGIVRRSWFIGFINISIIGHCTFTLLEEQYRKIDDTSPSWVVADSLFVSIFLVECLLKILDRGRGYFRKYWNIFDFALVILGLFCLAISIRTIQLKDQDEATPILQAARVLRVLRLIRLCRLLKSLHILADKKLYSKDFSVSDSAIRKHMFKIKVLTQFVKAHLTGVDELMHYFGTDSVEVARCVLQSHVAVHRAVLMAVSEEQRLDSFVVKEIAHLRTSHHLTDKLEEFLLEAHTGGIISHSEADSMIKFLHQHLKVTKKQIRKSINRMSKMHKTQSGLSNTEEGPGGFWQSVKQKVFGRSDTNFSSLSTFNT